MSGGGNNKPANGSIWTPKVIFATVMMLSAGTMNTISFKLQNKHNFQHGFLQTSLMFFGEYINLFIFAIIVVSFKPTHSTIYPRFKTFY